MFAVSALAALRFGGHGTRSYFIFGGGALARGIALAFAPLKLRAVRSPGPAR